MKRFHWFAIVFALIVIHSVVACKPHGDVVIPPLSIVTPQTYGMLDSSEARKIAKDYISALAPKERSFVKEFLGDLLQGDHMVSGVIINGDEYVLIGLTKNQLTMKGPDQQLKGMVYAVFISSTDLEVTAGGKKQLLDKGIYSWAVGAESIYLSSMTAPIHLDIEFAQPFENFTTITSAFSPIVENSIDNFAILIAGKQVVFRLPSDQTSQSPTSVAAQPGLPSLPGSHPTLDASPSFNVFDYPFAVGNSWSYSKTVLPAYNTEFWVKLDMIDGMTGEIMLDDPVCEPGTYSQTFTIVSQISEAAWEVAFTSSSEQCLGRYRDASQIVWSISPKLPISKETTSQLIEETITYNIWPESWNVDESFQLFVSNMTIPYVHRRHLAFMVTGPENSIFQNNYGVAIMLYGGAIGIEETPAGNLTGCSVTRALFSAEIGEQGEKKEVKDFSTGWQEIVIFCQGTGFAGFRQMDMDGNVISIMELAEFHITGQP